MATTSASNADDKSAADVATRSYFQKTVSIRDWWLIKSEQDFDGKRLGVAGLTSQEKQAVRVFSSAPILKRNDPLTLETVDGIYVIICSCINKVRTKENGFPSEFFNRFAFGFPTNWEEYAEKYLGEELSTKDVSTTLGRNKLSTDSGSVDNSNDGTPVGNKADQSPETKGGTEKTSFVSPESSSFRRSRSGRPLLPPLEFWRNQLVIYDADHKITGIQGLDDVDPSGGSRSEPQRKRGRHR